MLNVSHDAFFSNAVFDLHNRLPPTELALFAEYLLHVSDFSFHFAGDLFRRPSVLQIGVANRLPGLFFHFAGNLFSRALHFVCCA
jgi:hypothetical protein